MTTETMRKGTHKICRGCTINTTLLMVDISHSIDHQKEVHDICLMLFFHTAHPVQPEKPVMMMTLEKLACRYPKNGLNSAGPYQGVTVNQAMSSEIIATTATIVRAGCVLLISKILFGII